MTEKIYQNNYFNGRLLWKCIFAVSETVNYSVSLSYHE